MTKLWEWLTLDVLDWLGTAWEWLLDHLIELFVIGLVIALFVLLGAALSGTASWRDRQIDLCTRSFEYTHDQCMFIVDNHVNPGTMR